LQNKIWTADRLQIRQWPNNYFYQLCYRNLETVQHLFKDCSFTQEIWDKVTAGMEQNNVLLVYNPDDRLFDWWEKRTLQQDKNQTQRMRSLHMLLCWEVWCERNRQIFKGKELSMLQLVAKILDEVKLWSTCGAKNNARIIP
jgi:hypothetical protein